MTKLKNIETFDEHEKKFNLSDVIAMLPTEEEVEKYANGNFGYDEHSYYQELAFARGTDWMREYFIEKIKKNSK